MSEKRVSRRDFIKATGAGALAAGLGYNIIVPGRSHGAGSSTSTSLAYSVQGLVVPIRQPSSDVCWATAYTIMRSWKDQSSYDIRRAVALVGQKYRDMFDKNLGLPPQEFTPFLRAAAVRHQPMWNSPIDSWLGLLKSHGLLWVGTLAALPPSTSLHSRIVEGMRGNGKADGTWMKIVDPGNGGRYEELFRNFLAKYEGAFKVSQPKGAELREYYQIRHF